MKLLVLSLLALTAQARSVFVLGSVRTFFDKNKTVHAELLYQGTGELSGRWEIIRPGQTQAEDLQHFDIFLPPSGKMTVNGPEWGQLPQDPQGAYALRLQIDRVVDKGGPEEIRMAAAVPLLRYWAGREPAMALAGPGDGAAVDPAAAVELKFETGSNARYRIEITDSLEHAVLRVLLPSGASSYRLPTWMAEKLGDSRAMNWRLTALTDAGEVESATTWWSLFLRKP